MRIDEILKEINRIEREQEEANGYIRKLRKTEEEVHEDLKVMLKEIDHEFELCLGDPKLVRLVEERHEILKKLERECGEMLGSLEEERKRFNHKCDLDLEELRMEMKRLEAM